MTDTAPSLRLIAIGVATCNRPAQLKRVLASFETIKVPDGARFAIVVIDNGDPSPVTDETIAAFQDRVPWDVHFVHEPQRGIPFARNAMLETALATGAEVLIGLDDDELATPDWVINLLKVLDTTDHVLVGGPIERAADPDITLTASEAWYLEALQLEAATDAQDRARQAGRDDTFARVYTNNFALDLRVIAETGLRYDPAFALSGGEDSDFAMRLRDVTTKHGWANDAIVIEVLPRARLHLKYHLDRQVELGIMLAGLNGWSPLRTFRCVLETGWEAFKLGVKVPFTGKEGTLAFLFKVGRCKGYWQAMRGATSRHYAPETEHLR